MKLSQITQAVKVSATSLVILTLLIACSGSLTRESFDKVTNGMTVEEVKKLLGEPTSVDTVTVPILGNVTRFAYKTEKGEASVIFRDNQVQSKAGSIGQ